MVSGGSARRASGEVGKAFTPSSLPNAAWAESLRPWSWRAKIRSGDRLRGGVYRTLSARNALRRSFRALRPMNRLTNLTYTFANGQE